MEEKTENPSTPASDDAAVTPGSDSSRSRSTMEEKTENPNTPASDDAAVTSGSDVPACEDTILPQAEPQQDEETQQKRQDALRDSLEAMSLDQNFEDLVQVEPMAGYVEIRKPRKQEFVRIHPATDEETGEQFLYATRLLKFEDDGEFYAVVPKVGHLLEQKGVKMQATVLRLAVNTFGEWFLWAVPAAIDGQKPNDWHISHRAIAAEAESGWLRMTSGHGKYTSVKAADELDAPQWPQESFKDLLLLAFQDHWIDSREHPVVRQLEGRRAS